jgi:hypothetical protein
MVNRDWTIQRNWQYWGQDTGQRQKITTQKKKTKKDEEHELHQVVAKGKKFRLPIKHPPCYSYY